MCNIAPESVLSSGFVLLLLGVISACSLWLMPLPASVKMPIPERTAKIAIMVQANVFVIIAVIAGTLAAHATGFDAPVITAIVTGEAFVSTLGTIIVPALLGGVAASLVLSLYNMIQVNVIPQIYLADSTRMPVLTRLFYGGVTEELLMRWGTMSIITWLLWRLSGGSDSGPSGAAVCVAIVLSALVFGVSHLPAAVSSGIRQRPMLMLVVTGNALAATIFGWIFWQHGIESAIVAHFATHLIAMFTFELIVRRIYLPHTTQGLNYA